jgi:hypothetical protein
MVSLLCVGFMFESIDCDLPSTMRTLYYYYVIMDMACHVTRVVTRWHSTTVQYPPPSPCPSHVVIKLVLAVVVSLFTMAMARHVLVSLSLPAHDITGQSHSVDYMTLLFIHHHRHYALLCFFSSPPPFCCCCTFQTDTNKLTHPTLSSSFLSYSIFNFFTASPNHHHHPSLQIGAVFSLVIILLLHPIHNTS